MFVLLKIVLSEIKEKALKKSVSKVVNDYRVLNKSKSKSGFSEKNGANFKHRLYISEAIFFPTKEVVIWMVLLK